MKKELLKAIIDSWHNEEGNVNTTREILEWIKELNETTFVDIKESSINDSTFWFYDDYEGEVLNRKRSFFSIKGMRLFEDGVFKSEQPVIIQPEIGYLGIICRMIDGVLNFLMQAKIEPGNVNCVQISPTLQATKSNFTRTHGGRLPAYFELFEHSERFGVIYDQIQSEQASRFYKKRNRNMIMIVEEDIEIHPAFRWMSLGQIKKLMEVDNLVNMDTRTVLSGIPLIARDLDKDEKQEIRRMFNDKPLFDSIFNADPMEEAVQVFRLLNNYKMFKDIRLTELPLGQLSDWQVDEYGITCRKKADFMVRFYDIEISGREVRNWSQPLLKAAGRATFGLLTRVLNGRREYLVRLKPEAGSFDKVEIGPVVQWESTHDPCSDNAAERLFRKKYGDKRNIMIDAVLSEEGGRFYHEENNNVIIEVSQDELKELPPDHIWVSYAALNYLVQYNNCLNIQLRNLLSLVKM